MRTLLLLLFAATARAADPELVLHNGKVFLRPGAYAQALAVSGGRILKVGPERDVMALVGLRTRVLDLGGKAVTPGFHDAHVHFMKGGLSLVRADLFGSTSIAQVQEKLRAFAASGPEEDWLQGRGWDHTAFPGRAYPTRADLDAVISTRPVVLTHADGNEILWANSLALKLAGITAATPEPKAGQILRDAQGEPTGILTGAGAALLEKAVPPPSRAVKKAALKKALALARESGVTAIQGQLDVAPDEQLELWRELLDEGEVTLRYFIWGELDDIAAAERQRALAAGLGSDRLRVGGLKGVLDGVISARTAALLAPYSDAPEARGEARYTPAQLKTLVERARRTGFQTVLHAVGDRAVRLAVDACSGHNAEAGKLPSCKLEHMEVAAPSDLARMRPLGAVASFQPSHMTYDREDQNYNPERLGVRVKDAFAWRGALDAGVTVAFGTDWPVMPLHPRVGLFAAVTRRHFDGTPAGGWVPRQRVTLEEAVSAYTAGSALAIRRGKEIGTLGAGRLADLVVWDRDLFALKGLDLLKAEVEMTLFDGQVVYERRPVSATSARTDAP